MRNRGQRGQAVVETAIVLPTMVFFMLGIIQLSMLQNARLMCELAAFQAARAGAVWNADPQVMEDAALLTLVPTWQIAANPSNSEIVNFAAKWGELIAANKAAGLLSSLDAPKPVTVTTLAPVAEDFSASTLGGQEIDFDDPNQRLNTQLTVRVTYLFPLRIPYANWGIFHAFMTVLAGLDLNRRVDGWYLNGIQTTTDLTLAAEAAEMKSPYCQVSGITTNNLIWLVGLAAGGQYFLPVTSNYTIRMQSNPLKANVQPKANINSGC
jgi:hypothetical protein